MKPVYDWIMTDSLLSVMRRFLDSQQHEGALLNGAPLGLLVRRLLDREVAAGGPYRDEWGEIDPSLNQLIAKFFRIAGFPLQQLDRYLAGTTESPSSIGRTSVATWSPSPVAQAARGQLDALPEPLRAGALEVWQSVARADRRQEIAGLSQAFIASTSLSSKASLVGTGHALGVANFFTWMAYTIYDDLLDDDGDVSHLPAANTIHRMAVRSYTDAITAVDQSFVTQIFEQMDQANAWELAFCRFTIDDDRITIGVLPAYGSRRIIAQRAMAHVLGPLLLIRHYRSPSALKRASAGLRHYVIARQLNDDLCDWADDLRQGHCSPVVAHLLRKAKVMPGVYAITDLQQRLQRLFWQTELEVLSQLILKHCDRARVILTRETGMKSMSPFMQLTLKPIEQAVRAGLATHRQHRQFLAVFTHDQRLAEG